MEKWTTDWLNTQPVYYNEKTHKISYRFNDVVEWDDFTLHKEGLFNYLRYGYSLFEQTPVQDVKFLRYQSQIQKVLLPDGKTQILIEQLEDPCISRLGEVSSTDKVMERLRAHVREFEKSTNPAKRFLLPLSGGYDSRMLAHLIEDKSRIDAFTYGITYKGSDCLELKTARAVSKKLNISWFPMMLDRYNESYFLKKNFSAFGSVIPIHANYHMELYEKIISERGSNYIALSGSVGDWWAGQKVSLNGQIKSFDDFGRLFFNHGICGVRDYIKLKPDFEISRSQFEKNKELLKEDKYRRLFMARGRIALASYIFRTAQLYFETYTPYYDFELAMSMLNLPEKEARDRAWLKTYYANQGLDFSHVRGNTRNMQDIVSVKRSLSADDCLQRKYFEGIYDQARIDWINKTLLEIKGAWTLRFLSEKKRLEYFQAYNEWTALKPIEMLLTFKL